MFFFLQFPRRSYSGIAFPRPFFIVYTSPVPPFSSRIRQDFGRIWRGICLLVDTVMQFKLFAARWGRFCIFLGLNHAPEYLLLDSWSVSGKENFGVLWICERTRNVGGELWRLPTDHVEKLDLRHDIPDVRPRKYTPRKTWEAPPKLRDLAWHVSHVDCALHSPGKEQYLSVLTFAVFRTVVGIIVHVHLPKWLQLSCQDPPLMPSSSSVRLLPFRISYLWFCFTPVLQLLQTLTLSVSSLVVDLSWQSRKGIIQT